MSGSSQTPLDPTAGDTPGADGTDGQPSGRADTPHADRRGAWSARRIAVAIAAAVVVVWLIAKASEDLRQFAVVTLNGITLAALFFVVASGFTLIFGLMRVVNMAHGSLYLLGGYLALEMQDAWFKDDTGLGLSLSGTGGAEYDLLGWVAPLILATLLIGVVGVLIQQVFLRWNQGQDLRQALITIALSVEPSEGLAPTIVEDLVQTIKDLAAGGMGRLVVEQNLGVATSLADRQLVMLTGKIATETTAGELARDLAAQRRYLGVEPLADAV